MSIKRDELKKVVKEALVELRTEEAEAAKAKLPKTEKIKIEPDNPELPPSEEITDNELKEIVESLEHPEKKANEVTKYECPNYPDSCDYVATEPFEKCPKCGAGPISWD